MGKTLKIGRDLCDTVTDSQYTGAQAQEVRARFDFSVERVGVLKMINDLSHTCDFTLLSTEKEIEIDIKINI